MHSLGETLYLPLFKKKKFAGIDLACDIHQVIRDQATANLAKHEVPQLLIQAVTAYNDNPARDTYTGFVITMDGSILHLSKAIMSGGYMKDICEGRLPSENLKYYRPGPCDLLDQDGRREILRNVIGLYRYLNRKEGV